MAVPDETDPRFHALHSAYPVHGGVRGVEYPAYPPPDIPRGDLPGMQERGMGYPLYPTYTCSRDRAAAAMETGPGARPFPREFPPNRVMDYDKLQGTHHPSDLHMQIIRDINHRYVTVQNSSNRPVGVGVTTYYTGTVPSIRFVAHPGEIRHLGINSQGEHAQFLWLLDPGSGAPVGPPQIFARDSNDFVLRDGLNGWFVHRFSRPSYRARF